MSGTSILYTIGTALNRAHDQDLPVQVLVEGQWLSGQVGAIDGHGVVIASDQDHSVVRMQSISAVRICSPAPEATNRVPVTSGAHEMPSTASY